MEYREVLPRSLYMNDVNKQGKYYSFPSRNFLTLEDRILREVDRSADSDGNYYLNLFNLNDRITEESILDFYQSIPADSVAWNKSNYFSADVKFVTYDRFEKAVKLGEPVIDGYKVCIRTSFFNVNKEQYMRRRDEYYNSRRAAKDQRQGVPQTGPRGKRGYYDHQGPNQTYGRDRFDEGYHGDENFLEAKDRNQDNTLPNRHKSGDGSYEMYYSGVGGDGYHNRYPTEGGYQRNYNAEKEYYGPQGGKAKSEYSNRGDYYNYHGYDRQPYDRDSKYGRHEKSGKGYGEEGYGYDYSHQSSHYQHHLSEYDYGYGRDEYPNHHSHHQGGNGKHRNDHYDYSGKQEDHYDYHQSNRDPYDNQYDGYNYSSNAFSKNKQAPNHRDLESGENQPPAYENRRRHNLHQEGKHYRDSNHPPYEKESRSGKQAPNEPTIPVSKKRSDKPKDDVEKYYYGQHEEEVHAPRKHKAKSKEGDHDREAYDYYSYSDKQIITASMQKPTNDDRHQPPRRKEYDSTGGSSSVMVYDYMKDSNIPSRTNGHHPPPHRTGVFLAESGVQRDPESLLGEYDYMGSKKESAKLADPVSSHDSRQQAEQESKPFKNESYHHAQRDKQSGMLYTEKAAVPSKAGGYQHPQLHQNKIDPSHVPMQATERFVSKAIPAVKPSPAVAKQQSASPNKSQTQQQNQYSYYGATANEIARKYSEKAGTASEDGSVPSKTNPSFANDQPKKTSEQEGDWGRRKFFNKAKGSEVVLTKASPARDSQQQASGAYQHGNAESAREHGHMMDQ